MKINLDRLSRKIGYTFKNQAYLKQALTHCSVGVDNNERFEFLGDSILSFVIASELFAKFPQETEGQLSRLRAFLVKGDMLAEIGMELQLGDYLFLGQGELKSGGFRRASILADALEALFAAVYFDGGIDAARQVITSLYASRLASPDLNHSLKDAKTQLQEYLQSIKKGLPKYTLVEVVGDKHQEVFKVDCLLPDEQFTCTGIGVTRRKAEQEAAKVALEYLANDSKTRHR